MQLATPTNPFWHFMRSIVLVYSIALNWNFHQKYKMEVWRHFCYCKVGCISYISPTKQWSGRAVESRWETNRSQGVWEGEGPSLEPTKPKAPDQGLSFQGPIPFQSIYLGITLFIPLPHSTLPSDLICWSPSLPSPLQIKGHQDRFPWGPRLHLFLARAPVGKWPRTKYNRFIVGEKTDPEKLMKQFKVTELISG